MLKTLLKRNVTSIYLMIFSCISFAYGTPQVIITGKITDDAKIQIKWPQTTVTFTGLEIAEKFGLPEGSLSVDKNVMSKSGLPVIKYSCYCETDEFNRQIHISYTKQDERMKVVLHDKLSGKNLERSTSFTGADVTVSTPSENKNFSIKGQTLFIAGKGSLNLSTIIQGGTWKMLNDVRRNGYDCVAQWECSPDISKKQYCYCDSTIPPDVLSDNPTCTGFTRKVLVAFRKVDRPSVAVLVYETNFDEPKSFKLMQGQLYPLEALK